MLRSMAFVSDSKMEGSLGQGHTEHTARDTLSLPPHLEGCSMHTQTQVRTRTCTPHWQPRARAQ